MNKALEQFCYEYEAQVEISRKLYARRRPMSLSEYQRHHTALEVYEYQSFVDTEPYMEVSIPQHKLQELISNQVLLQRLMSESDYAARVVNQMAEDNKVRAANPAVNKAYENYKLLLELARR